MSTKSSIFLTNDNEHCYYEHSEYRGENECAIVLEIDPKHAEVISFPDDKESLIIQFNNPESQIYRLLELLQDKEEEMK